MHLGSRVIALKTVAEAKPISVEVGLLRRGSAVTVCVDPITGFIGTGVHRGITVVAVDIAVEAVPV